MGSMIEQVILEAHLEPLKLNCVIHRHMLYDVMPYLDSERFAEVVNGHLNEMEDSE